MFDPSTSIGSESIWQYALRENWKTCGKQETRSVGQAFATTPLFDFQGLVAVMTGEAVSN